MRLSFKNLFVRITDENTGDVIKFAAYGFYLVAALQILLVVLVAVAGAFRITDIIDPIVWLVGAYFLRKDKSRGVAGALMLFALITAITWLFKSSGGAGNGVSFLASVVALWAGWRGLAGAMFWQKRACSVVHWGHVAAGAAIAVIITVAALAVLTNTFTGSGVPAGIATFLLTAAFLLVPVAVLILFARARAYSTNDPACPWPPKG